MRRRARHTGAVEGVDGGAMGAASTSMTDARAGDERGRRATGRASNARADSGRWRHGARTALGALASASVTMFSGGSAMMAVLTVGGATTYVLDVSESAEGALGTIWLTAACACGTLGANGSWIGATSFASSVGLFVANTASLVTFCLWCTMHFRWIVIEHPGTAAACERALFALCPPVTGTVLTWAFASTSAGAEGAAFYGVVVCLIAHRVFLFPIESGCALAATDGQAKTERRRSILTEDDAKISTVVTLTLPVLAYLWTTIDILFESIDHAFACIALVTIPVLYLIGTGTRRSLWWWRRAQEPEMKKTEMFVLLLALMGFAVSLEGALVFGEFGEYIELPSPLKYIMVAVSVNCALVVFVVCTTNSIGEMVPLSAVQVVLAVATTTAICAMGAPIWMLPVPVAGSRAFIKYHYEDGSPTDYGTFAVSCVGCFVWFLAKNFWSLDVEVGSIHITSLCYAVLALAVMALGLPFALSTKSFSHTGVGSLVVGYVVALAVVEQILVQVTHEDGSLIYPPYLVISTSVCGVLASKSLVISGRMSRKFGWMVQSSSAAKLSMLFVHGPMEMFSVLIVVLTISAPHILVHRTKSLSAGDCINYCVILVVSLLFARFAMFEIIFEITGHRPTDATLFGGLLLITGASLAHLSTHHNFRDDDIGRRFLVMIIFFGCFLVTFRPPMPWKGEVGMWYDAAHVPDSEEDDARLYGIRKGKHHGWPSWLLMLAALTAMFSVSSPRKQTKAVSTIRIIFGAVCGGSVGLYMALEYFAEQWALDVFLFMACALVGVFLSFAYTPSATSSRWLPYVYTAYVCALSCAFVTQTGGSTVEEREQRLDGKYGVISVFAGSSLQIAFALKFQVYSSLESTRQRQRRRSRASPFLPATGRSRPEYFRGVASRNEHRELKVRSLAWMPIIGNIATLTSFAACVVLADELTGASIFSVFVLAPILLLLHQDSVMFPTLDEHQRYAPPMAVIVGKLCYDGVLAVLAGPNKVHVLTASASKLPWMMVNATSLFLASMSSMNLIHYLATSVRTSGMTLVLTAPLAVVPPFLSKLSAVRALSAVSVLALVLQDFLQRRAKIAGLKYL